MNKIYQGDCLDKLKEIKENSIDSVVTDPPYGISFMGKKWDYDVPKVEIWKEVLRVLKPGGHILCACGTRTQHRMAVNIEDAGFEIRDIVAWIYGSGFPKSLNIGKAVDKVQGNEREFIGYSKLNERDKKIYIPNNKSSFNASQYKGVPIDKGNSPHEGWGTALKPSMELWTLARKPLSEKTVVANVLKHGTGGINIDGCRVGTEIIEQNQNSGGRKYARKYDGHEENLKVDGIKTQTTGRFPANLIHDGSDEVVCGFPDSKNNAKNSVDTIKSNKSTFGSSTKRNVIRIADSGSASRFFYCAKASKSERNAGLVGFEDKFMNGLDKMGGKSGKKCGMKTGSGNPRVGVNANNHPTVKPVSLMRYLCRLITPKLGVVLDPFMGSGSTGIGAKLESFNFTGIEMNEEYFKIAKARIENAKEENEDDKQGTFEFTEDREATNKEVQDETLL